MDRWPQESDRILVQVLAELKNIVALQKQALAALAEVLAEPISDDESDATSVESL